MTERAESKTVYRMKADILGPDDDTRLFGATAIVRQADIDGTCDEFMEEVGGPLMRILFDMMAPEAFGRMVVNSLARMAAYRAALDSGKSEEEASLAAEGDVSAFIEEATRQRAEMNAARAARTDAA